MTTEEKAKRYDEIMKEVASSLKEAFEVCGDEADVDYFSVGEAIVDMYYEDRPIIPKEESEGD